MFVFVYGTLKVGHGNHRLMDGAVERVFPATVEGYTLHGTGIPFAVTAPGERVRGELIRLADEEASAVLDRLDSLEGHPTSYLRTLVVATRDFDGAPVPAWMYSYEDMRDRAPWVGEEWRPSALVGFEDEDEPQGE